MLAAIHTTKVLTATLSWHIGRGDNRRSAVNGHRADRLTDQTRPDQTPCGSPMKRNHVADKVTNISEAKASLSKLVERAERGERVIIGRSGKPVAMLVAYEGIKEPRKLAGDWTGKVWMADDFDSLTPELAAAFGVADSE